MFPSKYRLSKKTDFDRVFKAGRRGFDRYFSLRYLPNNLDHSRITVVVANKVSKKAVERNRLKRQVRAMIEERLDQFKLSYDLIVNVMSHALNQEYANLDSALEVTFKKNRII